ncbi:methionine aminotransferase [Flavobacterium sp. UMI-01]|uniref:methionine aminotransferase n=1 Tax=Flavobacterium sp. UMI-01 TaxID=1441053 RepID=UPI001C7DA4D7|nr:methionine aminotransferase [Flavobacterium sp. UMI-01]GIZ08760.1 aminotransferase [Flavobacterium sp. UMI-01]
MSKLPNVGTSIFSIMSQLATAHQAINLSQGFPDFPVNEKLLEITAKLTQTDVHQYTPMAGYPPLLDKIAQITSKQYNRNVDPNTEILVTTGATQGIFTAIQAFIKTGDQVILLDPSYDSYEPSITLCQGTAIRIPLNDDYTVNWEAVAQACNPKTRLIIINNPHNPTGKIVNTKDIEALENILENNPNMLLLADEVYEYITFEQKHISANSRPKLISRSIIASSFGKSFHITGWKVGYLIAPSHLMQEIKKVHQFLVFSVNSLSQAAIASYLEDVNLDEISTFYLKKRDYFRTLLSTTRFKLLPCEGTYFQVVSYAAISDENDVDFCKRLIREYGVAAIPISTFYANGKDLKLIRFCFAKNDATLKAAAQKLSYL